MVTIKVTHVLAVLSLVVLLMAKAHQTAAQPNCDPQDLRPCLPAISSGLAPTPLCCRKLKEQQPCYCPYLNNPATKPFIDSPNTRKVAATCGVTIPSPAAC